jgi:hypothetical protein
MSEMMLERRPNGDIAFSGVLSHADLVRVHLCPFDRAVLDDCEGEGRTPADWALAIELLFRRIEQQAPR